MHRAFTLIELLIVVAIIAILAAIAVPNFLEAQVRSKVSRTRADLRSVATGLEAYAADHNKYPPNVPERFHTLPPHLSTPTAYLSSIRWVDPFADKERESGGPGMDPEFRREYSYFMVFSPGELGPNANVNVGPEAVDTPGQNPGALARYGRWRLVGVGPDKRYNRPFSEPNPPGPWNPNPPALRGADIPYDPSNGTVTFGNLLRCQVGTEGARP